MNKSIVIIAIVVVAIGSILLFKQTKLEKSKPLTALPSISKSPTKKPDENVDYKAAFAIFTNGTFRIFTAPMYHNQSNDAYIEVKNPNIVRVKKEGTKWNDFFITLPFKLTKDCLTTGTGQTFCNGNNGRLRFYINGKEDTTALDKKISNGDRLLVTYGDENEQKIEEQIQKIPVTK